MRILARLVLALCFTVLSCTQARASLFAWQIEGTIFNVQTNHPAGPYAGAFALQDTFTWQLTFESDAHDYDASPSCAYYSATGGSDFSSGAVSEQAGASAFGQEFLLHTAGYTNGCGAPPGANIARLRSAFPSHLLLAMHLAGQFDTDALPQDADLVHAIGSFDIFYVDWQNPIANGRVTSITNVAGPNARVGAPLEVPEPMSSLLMGLGLVAARRRWLI